jgi:hypothetical protein
MALYSRAHPATARRGEGPNAMIRGINNKTPPEALNLLIEMGYVRVAETSTGGRPTTKIFINPNTQNTQKGVAR